MTGYRHIINFIQTYCSISVLFMKTWARSLESLNHMQRRHNRDLLLHIFLELHSWKAQCSLHFIKLWQICFSFYGLMNIILSWLSIMPVSLTTTCPKENKVTNKHWHVQTMFCSFRMPFFYGWKQTAYLWLFYFLMSAINISGHAELFAAGISFYPLETTWLHYPPLRNELAGVIWVFIAVVQHFGWEADFSVYSPNEHHISSSQAQMPIHVSFMLFQDCSSV